MKNTVAGFCTKVDNVDDLDNIHARTLALSDKMMNDRRFNEYKIYKDSKGGYVVEVTSGDGVADFHFGLPSQILDYLKAWWEHEEAGIHATAVMPPPNAKR